MDRHRREGALKQCHAMLSVYRGLDTVIQHIPSDLHNNNFINDPFNCSSQALTQ